MPNPEDVNQYDEEPVRYCSKCYSLKVRYDEFMDMECCMDCGCSDMAESSIEEWEKLYEKRYGHSYVNKEGDPKKSAIFKLPMDKLKTKVFNHPLWQFFIKTMYPMFPGGLGKADSVILFFDKLSKDNKLDELRLLMFKYLNKTKKEK